MLCLGFAEFWSEDSNGTFKGGEPEPCGRAENTCGKPDPSYCVGLNFLLNTDQAQKT